ncbi:hypothetical protein [Novosphingobium indicum]|uniref:hypothetical protein n=1 Tax=Novosphingobium indicum TaxID=462949 RepID=UPI00166582B6|nr:hypothetical protein [Novosphingobium indicum]
MGGSRSGVGVWFAPEPAVQLPKQQVEVWRARKRRLSGIVQGGDGIVLATRKYSREGRLLVHYTKPMIFIRTKTRLASAYRHWMARRAIQRSIKNVQMGTPCEVIELLIDSNVHSHTITHETGWVVTGESRFGSAVRGTGYAARIPVYPKGSKSETYEDVCYLAAIAQLAKVERAKLWTSHHLILERDPHPRARYADVGWFDFNLFGRNELPSIDGDPYDKILSVPFSPQAWTAPALKDVLQQSQDELYLALLKVMGPTNSQDAWHIRTAEVHGLYSFLTMDKKLLNIVHSQRDRPVMKNLKTKVMSPKMLGKELGLKPIELRHFDHESSSWFVRSDLDWGGERRPTRRHPK